MNKSFKKFSAVVAGLALSLTLTVPAFGATLGTNGTVTTDSDITINKSVVVANKEEKGGLVIAYPAMNFTYTVAPATVADGAKVTDANGNVAYVKPGLAGALTADNNGKLTIEAGTRTLNANGQEAVSGKLTFALDVAAYENANYGAGVYRYEIKDVTDAASLNADGVTRGSDSKTYYLDVYLTNATGGGLEPGGYVLTDENDDDITTDDNEEKKDGFDDTPTTPTPGEDPTPNDPSDDFNLDANKGKLDLAGNDHYLTYNVTVKKVITGSMGDKTNGFPFVATVSNHGLGYETEVFGNTTSSDNTALTTAPTTAATVSAKLSNGGTLKIWGLSPLATVNYTETNNTDETYKATVADKSGELSGKKDFELAKNATLSAYAEVQNVTNYARVDDKNDASEQNAAAVTFTNTLAGISPTGLVMRFAPFVTLMAAGMLLLLATKGNRAYEEE